MMLSKSTIVDRVLLGSTASNLRHPAFRLISANQQENPEVQINALMLTAVVVCQTIGLDPHDMVERAKRMVSVAEGPFTYHLQAIRDFAEGELRAAK